jgi:hypothetical protein
LLTKKKFERESKEIGVIYAVVTREVDQRGADQSIKVPNVSALEFAKRSMAYSIRLHFTLVLCPFGFSVLSLLFWSFHFPVFGTASQFAVFVQVTRWIFSYKVYSRQGLPASKRWKRHYLLMFSLTGILPLPLKFWLAFPDLGVLTAEQYGMVRAFIMERVRPSNFNEVEIDRIRTFYGDDADCMF